MPLILALDLGTNCGWALLDMETGQRVDSGTWRLGTRKGSPPGLRWRSFLDHVAEVMASNDVRAVAYERVRRHLGTSAAHVHGALRALTELAAHEHGQPVSGIEVSTWKKVAVGRGNADKASYIKAMNRRFKMRMNLKREDEAAALGVGVAALAGSKRRKP